MKKQMHLASMIKERVREFGPRVVLRRAITLEGRKNSFTWTELGTYIDQVASSLIKAGLKPGQMAGIFSQNMPEWTLADLGILTAGGVSVPIYATNTTSHAEYIINDAKIALVFVGEQEQMDKILPLLDTNKYLKGLVVLDQDVNYPEKDGIYSWDEFLRLGSDVESKEIEARLKYAQSEDLATLIYTSGTTGDPKGVMLTHENFMFSMEMHDRKLHTHAQDTSLSFLPLSHVFERAWTYFVLYKGMENNYLRNPKDVLEAIQKTRPSLMCTVPRLLEKIYDGINNKIQKAPAIQKSLFNWSLKTGNQVMHKKRLKQPVPLKLKVQHYFARKLIFNRLTKIFGGNIKFMPCAGSPLSAEINEFFHSIGINIKYGYGLTETTATVCAFDDTGFEMESIGSLLPQVEVKIGPESEIMVKGKNVMKGYYNKPVDTAQVFEDDWFKTGDAGSMDERGNIYFKERIKELIKTSVGKYISPQLLETIISGDKFIDQIAVFGDNRKFVTALVVPSFEFLEDYAKSKGITFENPEDLINHSNVVQFFREKIDQLQGNLPSYEQVKKFKLLPKNFSLEKNEVTPTLKLKRKIIEKKYKDEIDKMYFDK
ncbi:MAG: AMP-dependent synthetase/ligase [Candidatus Cyclobacteriaceae bacterium M3_2C_046]